MEIKQYYHLHITYFISVSILGGLLLWIPKYFSKPMPFIDALYNSVSAATITGLVATSAKGETTFDGFVLTTIMMLGNQILTSLALLHVRRHKLYCMIKRIESDLHYSLAPNDARHVEEKDVGSSPKDDEVFSQERQVWLTFWGKLLRIGNASYEEFYYGIRRSLKVTEPVKALYLEHDAMVLLTRVVVIYMIGVQILGFVVAEVLVLLSPHTWHLLKQNGVNHVLFSWFAVVSMFNNSGYSVVYENIMAVRTSSVLLLWLGLMILMGNTMFAPCLRGTICILHYFSKNKLRVAYKYLLDHRRNFYAHLFPRIETIWLMITILGFNSFHALTFLLSEWNGAALKGIKTKDKLVIAAFQSISTRNAGAAIVNFWQLSPGMLVVFAIMMYIAVYPVFLERQITRMKAKDWKRGIDKQILKQSKKLLAKDTAYLVISLFFLCLLERENIVHNGLNFSIFNIIFEVVSGYGNVGLSVGYSCQLTASRPCTDVPFCLSGLFTVAGKLVMIVVMLFGRHRGLWETILAATTTSESYKSIDIPIVATKI